MCISGKNREKEKEICIMNGELFNSNKAVRGAGVLLAISSLPSEYGIGTMGEAAYKFIDECNEAGFTYWQILPIGPTGFGDSPYQTVSSFAGNPYFIDLDMLITERLLTRSEVKRIEWNDSSDTVSYGKLWAYRYEVLRKAYSRSKHKNTDEYRDFIADNSFWLNDFALFMSLKSYYNNADMTQWDEDIRMHEESAVKEYSEKLADDVDFWKFLQFKFFEQWEELRSYAALKGVKIIGDVPLYTSYDSADVWANRQFFKLDKDGRLNSVAGCPPDAFSNEGQKWGNPLYDWAALEEADFKWWRQRISFASKLYDALRIDHFIGLIRYYDIPVDESAKNGTFREGPKDKLLNVIDEERGSMVIIAENLGIKPPAVDEAVKSHNYYGMNILQFAFGGDPDNEHLPYNLTNMSVLYGGTHDNETLMGFFSNTTPENLQNAYTYTGTDNVEDLIDGLYRAAYNSVADIVIFQMQDILKLGNEARMNFPSIVGINWKWRMKRNAMSREVIRKFNSLAVVSGRVRHEKNVLRDFIKERYGKDLDNLSKQEIYAAILVLCNERARSREKTRAQLDGKRKVYYISAEFLIGKLMGNNLINLGLYDEISEELSEIGVSLAEIEELEAEPSLGNGGLGRLAACFLDSIATLGLNGDGVGLNYHLGLFKQTFNKKGLQSEEVNPWIDEKSFLIKTDKKYTVKFGDMSVESTLYDIEVTGYNSTTNRLHLFDLDSVDDSIVGEGIDFDKTDIRKNLTLFLYPDDSDEAGNLLRVYQQYFMVSNAAQLIIEESVARGSDLHDLDKYAAVQINDTHPSMVIPELIRLLTEAGIDMDEAIAIVSRTCAYTNHTILAEALEKWPLSFIEKVAPAIVPIIEYLDKKVKEKYSDESVYIIDKDNRVHMAHMDIHFGYSVNGVAFLHTEILKNSELANFYKLYPGKFNNKTNGITFRRWLLHCNRNLAQFIETKIGPDFKKDANDLEKLLRYSNDMSVLDRMLSIKQENKKALADYIYEKEGVTINPDSIFDIQVKRLHEYKRQQLNILYAIRKYLDIKAGEKPATPITMIFGAKAAPAYTIAKDIIHLIICMQKLTESDPEVSPYLKVVMLENYNVTYAEKVIPACDISEQISLASKEASGTGNMKFMLNGAVTLGTMDGANVEIRDLVGDDNIYIFGEDSDTVIERYKRGDYVSRDYYEKDERLKEAVDFITGKEIMKVGDKESLTRLYNELLNKDWFMTFPDFESYVETKDRVLRDYDNRYLFARKMLINVAKAGFFSSDRTIAEYNRDIWKAGK